MGHSDSDLMLKEIIDQLLDEELDISIYKTKGITYYDLHTGAKSNFVLYEKDGRVYGDGRYKKEILIDDFRDVLYNVSQCLCGRDYMRRTWIDILKKHGFNL